MEDINVIEQRWTESKKTIALLVLLEYQYPDILSIISSSKINEDDLLVMVEYALNFGSRHWAEKAVSWIESGLKINESIASVLNTVSTSKRDTQNLRHRAQKQFNRWQNENT